jgi:hypothetical protein
MKVDAELIVRLRRTVKRHRARHERGIAIVRSRRA